VASKKAAASKPAAKKKAAAKKAPAKRGSGGYGAKDITVLEGLEAVRKRPGMYIGSTGPRGLHHLVYEVVDNSVDEALAGYCKEIAVTIHADESITVVDDGRGVPVDIHPEEGRSAAEVIMTVLHAGGKFDDDSYKVSGGLHGVGVSVVNALSKNLEVWVRRDGKEYNMSFVDGERRGKLDVVGKVAKTTTGTTVRFWPNPKYFDSPQFSLPRLKHMLRAKAVLCPGLEVTLEVEKPKETERWVYTGGLEQYLKESLGDGDFLPEQPFAGKLIGKREAVEWAVVWRRDGAEALLESYVNLIPTPQGGTHTNGLRTGLTEALREFCEFRNLMPRGIKLAPEDVWEGVSFVLSVKIEEPQFSGQTKERLSSRECATLVGGLIKDHFALWLNQHPETGDAIAQFAIENAQHRLKAAKQVVRKRAESYKVKVDPVVRLHYVEVEKPDMADPASEAISATLLTMSLFMMTPRSRPNILCGDHSGGTQDLLSRSSNTKYRNQRDNIELEQFESNARHQAT